MALLWCDGFDHYGSDSANMTDGPWAELDAGGLTTTNPRTGTYARQRSGAPQTGALRRVFGGAKTTVGVGAAWWFSDLPTDNNRYTIYGFRDTANIAQVSVILQSTGIIEVFQSQPQSLGASLGATTVPVITAEAYTHIEVALTVDGTVGEVEVRVNGVTVLSITGANTDYTGKGEVSQMVFFNHRSGGGTSSDTTVPTSYMDDLFAWDDTGSYNNDFIGDRRVLTLLPNGDTLQDDWTPIIGTDSFEMINDAEPDDDATYVFANPGVSPDAVSEYEMENLPVGVSSVSAVVVVNRMRKTDAGVANVQAGLVSGVSESLGADNPMTEAYTYYEDIVEADPDTAAPFTPSAVDAAKLKITRTA